MKREHKTIRISTRERKHISQNGICVYCGKYVKWEKCSLDHVIPWTLYKEENTHDSNYVMTCKYCNRNKDNHIVFTNLEDKIIYPVIDVPYFFRVSEIQSNGYKQNNGHDHKIWEKVK